ncbi:GNAT family N-acetyltransferase [Flavobacteriales bacterium 33_180_T64]|nr:GNAT family N-acetyltransferase [Flavobacteriales bacterium 33_180_T64]
MISYKIYNSVDALPVSWDELIAHDIFLKRDLLRALEQSYPYNITAFYVGVFKSETLVGMALVQRVEMYIDNVFRKTSTNYFKQIAKQLVSKIVKGNALVVGNLMHTGQHGLFFNSDMLTQEAFLDKINECLEELSRTIRRQFDKKIRIVVFKDYFESDMVHKSSEFFEVNKLYKVQVQPNMIFSVNQEWQKIEDYISALNKKYKRRYKTARKKALNLIGKELSFEEVQGLNSELFALYKNVSDNARVNSFILSENHFSALKEHLKDKFKVFGYFKNNELVGFYTLILNNDILETYFLGYNQQEQQKYQMYLNMLYDMACYAIEHKFKKVVYARTAMEIKSSVGAKPHTMHIYLKHTNSFIANTVLKLIVKYMNPIRKWEERHPFKK